MGVRVICSRFMHEINGKGTSGEIQYLSLQRFAITLGNLGLFIFLFYIVYLRIYKTYIFYAYHSSKSVITVLLRPLYM